MKVATAFTALALINSAVALASVDPHPVPAVRMLATYPNGTFLENLAVLPDGTTLFTSYADKRLYRLSTSGEATLFAQLDVHPIAILPVADGFILTAHASSFFGGPSFMTSNRIVRLDATGTELSEMPVADARFLNGLVAVGPDLIVAADSIAGRIWAFVPSTATVTPWLDDPLLATGDAAAVRPGANGLKLHNGLLYVSNSARGAIYRMPIVDGRPAGPIALFASTGPVDDFAFRSDGRIVATTHGERLIEIAADGRISDIISTGCDGCTSVAVDADGRSATVLTTGGLLEGGTAPARVLKVELPE